MKLTAESTVINDQKINTDIDTAQTTANDAKTIADNTNQYFWFTSSGTDTGAHITEKTQSQFLASPSGGNLLARSNGIAVRDGLTELATFGTSATIGKTENGASRVEIGDSSIALTNRGSDGVDRGLSISSIVTSNNSRSTFGTPNIGIAIIDGQGSTATAYSGIDFYCYGDSTDLSTNTLYLKITPTSISVTNPATGGDYFKVTNGNVRFNNYRLANFVIGRGTDGIWTYEQYMNGTYHAWYEGTINLNSGTAMGGGYYHQSSAAHTAPSFSNSVTSLTGASNGASRYAYMGHSSTYYTYWWDGSSGSASNVAVRLDMYGTFTPSPT